MTRFLNLIMDKLHIKSAHIRELIIDRAFKAIPLLAYCAVYIALFAVIEHLDFSSYADPSLPIDHMIPFIPCFVLPYLMWFIFVPAAMITVLFKDEELYRKLSWMLMIGMSIFLVVSLLFPNELHLRPDIKGGNIFCWITKILYMIDTPTNVAPSIHVFDTCVALEGVLRCRWRITRIRWVRVSCTVLAVLIIASTLFIKQHSVVDVGGGLLMYAVMSLILEVWYLQKKKRRKA